METTAIAFLLECATDQYQPTFNLWDLGGLIADTMVGTIQISMCGREEVNLWW